MTTANMTGSPIRYPDVSSSKVMTVRGWWLVVLNFLIPGSAQVLAGNRKLGRFGLWFTLSLWFLAIVGVIVYLIWPQVIFSVVTMPIPLTIAQIVLVAYAVLWVILTLDTLRLVRLVRVGPRARPALAAFSVLLLVLTAGWCGRCRVLRERGPVRPRQCVLGIGAAGASGRRAVQHPPPRR